MLSHLYYDKKTIVYLVRNLKTENSFVMYAQKFMKKRKFGEKLVAKTNFLFSAYDNTKEKNVVDFFKSK